MHFDFLIFMHCISRAIAILHCISADKVILKTFQTPAVHRPRAFKIMTFPN